MPNGFFVVYWSNYKALQSTGMALWGPCTAYIQDLLQTDGPVGPLYMLLETLDDGNINHLN